jgi:hypothetical protein
MTFSGLSAVAAASAVTGVAALPAKSIDLDDPNSVSPGILGFLAFFLLAVALIFLVRNMNGHLRRVRYRQEALDAEQAEQARVKAAAEATANTEANTEATTDDQPQTPH